MAKFGKVTKSHGGYFLLKRTNSLTSISFTLYIYFRNMWKLSWICGNKVLSAIQRPLLYLAVQIKQKYAKRNYNATKGREGRGRDIQMWNQERREEEAYREKTPDRRKKHTGWKITKVLNIGRRTCAKAKHGRVKRVLSSLCFFPFFITRLWWNGHESILQHASLYDLLYSDAKQVVLRWNFPLFSKRWRVGTLVPSEEMSPDIRGTLRVENLSFPAVFRT